MNTIQSYMDEAKARAGIKSDRKLAVMAGLKPNAATFWRVGKSLPNDEVMVQIARLAGVDETAALMDLNVWRTSGRTQSFYVKMREALRSGALTASVAVGVLFMGSGNAFAFSGTLIEHVNISVLETIHYHIKRLLKKSSMVVRPLLNMRVSYI